MTNSNSLFAVLESIVSDEFKSANLADAAAVQTYAENAMGVNLSAVEAALIIRVAGEWDAAVKSGGEWSKYRADAQRALETGTESILAEAFASGQRAGALELEDAENRGDYTLPTTTDAAVNAAAHSYYGWNTETEIEEFYAGYAAALDNQ